MDFDVLNPNATATFAFQGLAVFCFNQSYNGGQGRWEIAVPHFSGHEFLIKLPGAGVLKVQEQVKKIAIKARVGVPTEPKYVVDPFDRRDAVNTDRHDCRWLEDFTNDSEIGHGPVSIIKDSGRTKVTMVYVYQSIAYTKSLEEFPLILATQADTCPVVGGVPRPLPDDQAGRVLDSIRNPYGFAADTFGMDIEGGPGGEAVDIILDNGIQATIPKADQPQEILITNLEPPDQESPPHSTVDTDTYQYGRGDFFRYYELFRVARPPFHLWTRRPHPVGPQPGEARTGDCNGVSVNFPNLGDLT